VTGMTGWALARAGDGLGDDPLHAAPIRASNRAAANKPREEVRLIP